MPIEVLSLLGGMLLWQLAGVIFALPWLPPVSAVLAELAELILSGAILANLVSSLQALAIGFGLALFVGIVVGAVMGRFRKAEQALDIYVSALLVTPPIVLIPVFFILFGLSDVTRIVVVFMYAVFVIIINTMTGIKTIDPALIEMARSMCASERQIVSRILIMGALPMIFAGIQLGAGRAVKGMINAELLITFVGLGALAQSFGSQFESAKVFAVELVIIALAIAINFFVKYLDARLTHWSD